MNQKSIIAVLGVAVVILIGTTVYFATINKSSQPATPAPKVTQQPTPAPAAQQPTQPANETASWQTYQNKKFGYQIKYPPYWIKNSFPSGDVRSALEYKGAGILLEQLGHGVPFDWKTEKSTVSVNGLQLEVSTFIKDKNIVSKIVSVSTKTKNQEGKEMTINIELTGAVEDSSIKDFDKIISTLKFTK